MRPGDEVVIQKGPYATRRGVVLGDTDPDAGRVRIRVDDGMEALVQRRGLGARQRRGLGA